MGEISAKDVSELRKMTGAGMMDCKKALTEAEGSVERAVEILRVKGIAKAAGKSDRATREGLVVMKLGAGSKSGAIVEVNCETDFVARTDDFKAVAAGIVSHILNGKSGVVTGEEGEALLHESFHCDNSKNVEEFVKEGVAKLGENMRIGKFSRFEISGGFGIVNFYDHMNGKVGVLIELGTDDEAFAATEELKLIAEEIAIHICAFSPEFISPEDVPADTLEKEKAIYREQTLAEGKPENIVERIVTGRLGKYYSEVCLLKQAFYRDETGKQTVEDFIKSASGGHSVSVKRFSRIQLGG